jgi:Cdc6-like AAA superfamily ATPase
MGNPQSKTKYALLYGNTGSGKTLMQYSMQTSLKVFDKIESIASSAKY